MPTYQPEPVNINDLVDIRQVKIDKSLPISEKIRSYHRQIRDPHCYRHGETIVRISYANEGPSMKILLQQYLLSGQHTELIPNS